MKKFPVFRRYDGGARIAGEHPYRPIDLTGPDTEERRVLIEQPHPQSNTQLLNVVTKNGTGKLIPIIHQSSGPSGKWMCTLCDIEENQISPIVAHPQRENIILHGKIMNLERKIRNSEQKFGKNGKNVKKIFTSHSKFYNPFRIFLLLKIVH